MSYFCKTFANNTLDVAKYKMHTDWPLWAQYIEPYLQTLHEAYHIPPLNPGFKDTRSTFQILRKH